MDATDAPHAADVAIGVTAVELVLVIQVNRRFERLGGRFRPLENLLGPVHAQEAMHFAQVHHLLLRRVPQVIVSLALLQLLPATQAGYISGL